MPVERPLYNCGQFVRGKEEDLDWMNTSLEDDEHITSYDESQEGQYRER